MKLEQGKSIVEEVEKLGVDKNLHGEVTAPHAEAILTMDAKRKAVEKMLADKTAEATKDLELDNHPTLKTEDGRKMHLNESLFEDFEDEHIGKVEKCTDEECETKDLKEGYKETAFEMTADGKKVIAIGTDRHTRTYNYEDVEFKFDGKVGNGTYRWQNRPWQRFDYDSALSEAMINAGIDEAFVSECMENSHSLESAIKYFAENYGKKDECLKEATEKKEKKEKPKKTKYDALYDGLLKAKYSDGTNLYSTMLGEFAATDSSDNAPFEGIKVTSKVRENLKPAEDLAKALGLNVQYVDHTDNANLGNKYFLFIDIDEDKASELVESLNKNLKEELKVFIDFSDYEPWSGAVDTYEKIVAADKLDELENLLEDSYPEGISTTGINDLLWFESDWVFDMLGMTEDEEDEDKEDKEEEE